MKFDQGEGTTWWYDETDPVLSKVFDKLRCRTARKARIERLLGPIAGFDYLPLVGIVVGGALATLGPLWLKWTAGVVCVVLVAAVMFLAGSIATIHRLVPQIRRGDYGWAFMASDEYAWMELERKFARSTQNVLGVITTNAPDTRQLLAQYLTAGETIAARKRLSTLDEPAAANHWALQKLRTVISRVWD